MVTLQNVRSFTFSERWDLTSISPATLQQGDVMPINENFILIIEFSHAISFIRNEVQLLSHRCAVSNIYSAVTSKVVRLS